VHRGPAGTYAAGVSEADPSPAAEPGTARRPALLTALDPPTVPFAIGGMILWAVIGLVLLLFKGWLNDHGHTDWLWICLAGFLLGFPGLAQMIRHDRRRRARRANTATDAE
jgi:hypothetical protein